jgi:hypothetical protein
MTRRLLDRQIRLIHYLTMSGAIFGDAEHRPDPMLRGINRHLLGMEARFSFEKRIEKIAAVLPRTFDLLGPRRMALTREFVEAYPPDHIGRYENARQFCNFLTKRNRRESPGRPRGSTAPRRAHPSRLARVPSRLARLAPQENARSHLRMTRADPTSLPPYLPDIATCELAVATARLHAEEVPPGEQHSSTDPRTPLRSIRRAPGAVLLRASYDIRPLFESASKPIDPVPRDVRLAIVAMPAGHPEIFELAPAVFDLLALLDDWTDASTFGEWSDAGELTAELLEARLLEVRR